MKKITAILLLLIFIILGIPFFISFFWVQNDVREKEKQANKTEISVLKTDTGKIENVNIEDYLFGVLAGEMPASFESEALKAQAVAARTYIISRKNDKSKDDVHPDADVCTDSTHCKAWLSDKQIEEKFGKQWFDKYEDKLKNAINDTSGEVMLYNNEPIVAVFHAVGSGKTENSEDVWGGKVPYLRSVDSPGDKESPDFLSEVMVSKSEFNKKTGSDIIGEITRSEGGGVKSIIIGDKTMTGKEIRSLFGLNSANFTIEDKGDNFVFHVKGHGHGVGMSQYGANAMAKEGKNYKEILSAYYSGISFGE